MAMEIINGFPCKTCTDVDYAKKNIDPAHPKDGPFGVKNPQKQAKAAHDKAIKFGGSLTAAGLDRPRAPSDPTGRPQAAASAYVTGSLVNLTA
jgi:hypothetical protein